MNAIQLVGAVETGLIYSLVAIGIYLSFRTLNFPDLTVDGSFPLGAAVCAAMIISDYHPYVATLTATIAGACAGLVTAWLSTHLKMLNILAGILTSTALYSLNIRIMGRPNVALLGEETIFSSWLAGLPTWAPLAGFTLIVALLIYLFLNTQIGLAIRATGNNPKMGRAQGINDRSMILVGLAISNAAVAFAGSLFAQKYGFADVTLGVGTIIVGLASVIIGESLLPTRTVLQSIIACMVGAVIYRIVVALALNVGDLGLHASDLNMVTAGLVVIAMLLPSIQSKFKRRRGGAS